MPEVEARLNAARVEAVNAWRLQPERSPGTDGGMIILRILLNAIIMGLEIGAIVAISWLGYRHPYWFAALTALLAFMLGVRLEVARLRNELKFYFDRPISATAIGIYLVAAAESVVKGLLGGLVALLTFAGTNDNRLYWVAVVFAVVTYAGSGLLRRLSISFAALPSRWGYFRLAPPLGLLFALGIGVLTASHVLADVTLGDIGRHIVLELPARPSIDQVSELLFLLKQYADGVIAALLSAMLGADWGKPIALVLSVNALTGFVAAIYALILAETVVKLEDKWLG